MNRLEITQMDTDDLRELLKEVIRHEMPGILANSG